MKKWQTKLTQMAELLKIMLSASAACIFCKKRYRTHNFVYQKWICCQKQKIFEDVSSHATSRYRCIKTSSVIHLFWIITEPLLQYQKNKKVSSIKKEKITKLHFTRGKKKYYHWQKKLLLFTIFGRFVFTVSMWYL